MPHASTEDLNELVEDLAKGEAPGSARLALLSDLTRDEADIIRGRWQTVPASTRESLFDETTILAEMDVTLDFHEFAKIGLDDPEAAVRLTAIAALWEATDRDTADRLTRLLQTDPEESVREAAAGSLRDFVLLREMEEIDAEAGDGIVDALRSAFEDSGEATNVRAAAIESLGPRTLPWVNTLITDAYYHEDRVLRIAAVRAMADSANPDWLPYLEEDLRSTDAELRFEAVVAVGEVGPEEAVDLVAPLLEDEDRQVVLATIRSLGALGGDAAIEILEDVVAETDDAELREEATAAIDIARFGEEQKEGGDDDSWDE
ncbi:MAG TPA: HEAT repeat domain-containing protein [Tepidiformaceae bacterium]|nr:HEAT repeat domain-containing protein [Tepidiformaceae bacterium]